MAHIVGHYGKSDGTALAERSNSVDGTSQPLLANLQQDSTAHTDAFAVRIAYLAFCLEVTEVAHDSHLLPSADSAAYLIVDIGQCGAAWRAYLGIIQSATLLRESLFEDAVL